MLRIVGSTLSLVGSGRHSIVPVTNGSQRVGGRNPVSGPTALSSVNLQSQNWTESCEEVQKKIINSKPILFKQIW